MAGSLSPTKADEWQWRLSRFQQSQLTVAAFCRQEGVSAPSFYLWRKRLALSRPTKHECSKPSAGFRPVRLLPSVGVSVELPGGTQLVVPTTDMESLRLVVELLARVDADRIREGRSC
jgi:transposase-like protein